jgi:hypothetical protein
VSHGSGQTHDLGRADQVTGWEIFFGKASCWPSHSRRIPRSGRVDHPPGKHPCATPACNART